MSEKEFWTKYSRAQYLHSTKNVVAAAAEAAEDEELAVFLKRDDMLANEARRKVSSFVTLCFHHELAFFSWNAFCFQGTVFVWPHLLLFNQIRRVDPTVDIEADEGDDYTHLPVNLIHTHIL